VQSHRTGATAHRSRSHHARVTIAQLREDGWSDASVCRAEKAGALNRLFRGVYEIAAAPATWEGRAYAAWLTAGHGALISGLAAAFIWGLAGFTSPGIIDVVVPRHLRPRRRTGVRYHESLALDHAGPTMRNGLPVTGIARTLLDICAVCDFETALAAVDDARRRNLVTMDELWECLLLHARRGRPGIRKFRRILVKRDGKTVPHGRFARLFERLIEHSDLPMYVHEHTVVAMGHVYRLDGAYVRLKIGIELDDRGTHAKERAFEEDRIRHNRLATCGWLVIYVTWRRFIDDPQGVLAEIREAIALRSCVR